MKLNPKVGEVWSRICPPEGGQPGYCQSGEVVEVNEDEVVVRILADQFRSMRFRRSDGRDTSGLGTFLVRPDTLPKK